MARHKGERVRALQRLVEDPLSERLLWKAFRAGQIIVVDTETDPETNERVIAFTAKDGFEPPTMEMVEETAGAGEGVATD